MSYNTKNYDEQGGARTVIGGSLDVVSGGDLDVESGAAIKLAGTAISASAAELNQLDGILIGAGAMDTASAADGAHTVALADNGKVFIATKADGATTFTLPAPVVGLTGVKVTFIQTVDQNMVITGTADKMIVLGGDGTSQSATFSTASEKIGAAAFAICTGTMWIVVGLGNATITVS